MGTEKKRRILDGLVAVMLPIAFIGPIFLNMYAFVLDGHRHEWFRQGVVLGVQAIAAILFFIKVIFLLCETPKLRKPILLTALIPVVFAVVHLWAILVQADGAAVLKEAVINGAYLVSACCAVIIVVSEKCLTEFLETCKNYALILSPIVIYYCVRFYLPSAEYGVRNLGVLNYMAIAYGLMEFCTFLLMKLLISLAKEKRGAFPWLDFALYTLFSIGITLSETKGTILCLIWGGVIAFIYAAVVRYGVRTFGCFALSSLLAVVLFSSVLAPNYGVENRVVAFLKELMGGTSVGITADNIEDVSNILNEVPDPEETTSPEQTEPPIQTEPPVPTEDPAQTGSPEPSGPPAAASFADILEYVNSGEAAAALEAGTITQEEYDSLVEMSQKLNNTSSAGRIYLWTCALQEIKAAPLTGQGPYFYQGKYGTYPHNFFLEIATDFGLVVMLVIAVLGIYVFIRLIQKSLKMPCVAAFTLFVLFHLPQKMLSGSLYDYTVFFQYGLCLVILVLLWRYRKRNDRRKESMVDESVPT